MNVDGTSTYATKPTHQPFPTLFVGDTVRPVLVLLCHGVAKYYS